MTADARGNSTVTLIEAAYRTFGNNEFEQFFALVGEGFEWLVSEGFPYGGRYQGSQAVMDDVFSAIQADWETFALEVDRYIDGGETVVAIGEYEATHDTTGDRVVAPFAHVWDIEAGKIRWFQQFTDNVQFQAALPPADRTDFD